MVVFLKSRSMVEDLKEVQLRAITVCQCGEFHMFVKLTHVPAQPQRCVDGTIPRWRGGKGMLYCRFHLCV